MPVYIYETVPQKEDNQPARFAVYQSIHAEPLNIHPETGIPIRRIIIGGVFIPNNTRIKHTSSNGGFCGTC